MRSAIADEANTSQLPVGVRDAIADNTYDRRKPYRQEIRGFLKDSSMLLAVQIMRAAARGLRNSDHADVGARRALLKAIVLTWSRVLRILTVLSPVLVSEGAGGIDGLNFNLDDSFKGMDDDEKWHQLIRSFPWNVVNFYGGDLYSAKMAPMYYEFMDSDSGNPLVDRHLMAVHISRGKPRGWALEVGNYINSLPKDSFYLSDMATEMKRDYDYGYADSDQLSDLRSLIGKTYGKHFTGAKQPNRDLVEKYATHVLGAEKKQVEDKS